MSARKDLTASQLIEALQRIPGDTIITWTTVDFDHNIWTSWGIEKVEPNGDLSGNNIVRSGALSDDYDEDDD